MTLLLSFSLSYSPLFKKYNLMGDISSWLIHLEYFICFLSKIVTNSCSNSLRKPQFKMTFPTLKLLTILRL